MPVRPGAGQALVGYMLLAVVGTWPLVRGLASDVPWDMGDPLLNMWILSWVCEQILGILRGDFSRVATFFDANIFYPSPLTLAYSEHLFPQAVQILPVYLATRNPILCYNLLFFSTIALSGLGMYLFVRELTGNAKAAFVAGLAFAFAPYRLPQSGHLQVLSAQWMPFAFYGLLRYFESRRIRPLAGAALALTAQVLSCGYYLFFFTPFVVAFGLWEIGRRGLWRQWRMWWQLASAALGVVALTLPFLLPYVAIRSEGYDRALAEIARFSADVYSYATASAAHALWGTVLQAFPKAEGELFPGLTVVLLAAIGVILWNTNSQPPIPSPQPPIPSPQPPIPRSRLLLTWLFALTAAAHGVAVIAALVMRRINTDIGPFTLRITDISQVLLRGTVVFAVLLLISPGARRRVGAFMQVRGFYVLALIAALWLSLGPSPQALGRPVEIAAPYRVLYDHVPGFDGIRVPARMAMMTAFMLAVLTGFGAAVLARYRLGQAALVLFSATLVFEGTRVPFTVNGMGPLRDYNAPEARVFPPARAPLIYQEMTRQPPESVLIELPLGEPDFDLRAVYYSTVHWRRVVNGYSGFFPPQYARLWSALTEVPRHPELSLEVLRVSRATHVIVHEGAYRGDEGRATSAILRNAGAVQLFREGYDVLFRLPGTQVAVSGSRKWLSSVEPRPYSFPDRSVTSHSPSFSSHNASTASTPMSASSCSASASRRTRSWRDS